MPECPKCGLICTESEKYCACGYSFTLYAPIIDRIELHFDKGLLSISDLPYYLVLFRQDNKSGDKIIDVRKKNPAGEIVTEERFALHLVKRIWTVPYQDAFPTFPDAVYYEPVQKRKVKDPTVLYITNQRQTRKINQEHLDQFFNLIRKHAPQINTTTKLF